MAKKGTRRGLASRVWSPFGYVLGASGNTVKELANTAGNVTKRTVNGARRVGTIWTNAVNSSIKNVTRGGSRKRRGGKKSRRNNRSRRRR